MSDITSNGLMMASVVILMLCCGGLGWLLSVHQKKIRRLEKAIAALRGHVEVAADSGVGVGRKVITIEKRLRATEQKQQEIESTDLQKVSYNEAVRLISMGAKVDDLVSSCGLTRAEANLLEVLYVSQTASQIKNR